MEVRTNEREITFYNRGGHDHDGENSTPIKILPGAVSLNHLNPELVNWIQDQAGGGSSEPTTDDFMVKDLEIATPPIAPGASHTGQVQWVGACFVRFLRIVMSQDTECTVTFYHKPTFDSEDREFRVRNCGNKFMWEGVWAHYDEEQDKQIYYRVENTGNNSASFKLYLKSGTMVTNTYASFIDSIIADEVQLTGTITLKAGPGISIESDGANGLTFSLT